MTKAELRRIVAEVLEVDTDTLASDTELKSIETFDSVSILSLIIELDEKAGIKLGPGDASSLERYGDIEDLAASQGIALSD